MDETSLFMIQDGFICLFNNVRNNLIQNETFNFTFTHDHEFSLIFAIIQVIKENEGTYCIFKVLYLIRSKGELHFF